jgi:hypothetical protein
LFKLFWANYLKPIKEIKEIMKIKATIFILIALFISACATGTKEAKFNPKRIIKRYVKALKAKDLNKLKEVSTLKTISLLEQGAKQKNMTLEEMIKSNDPQIQPILEDPEIRNEKIEGDQATVEIKNPDDGEWSELIFVKEDNRWKLGVAETLLVAKKQIDEKPEKEGDKKEADADKKEATDKKEDVDKKKDTDKKEEK